MPSKSRKLALIAIPVLILLIAITRLASDGGTGGPWVVVLGVVVALGVVVLIFALAIRLTRRRRLRAVPLLEDVRRDGATAYLCSEARGADFMIVAIDDAHDLTLYRVDGSKLAQRMHLASGAYSLREGPVAIDLVSTTPGLVVEQFGQELIGLHVNPDDGREIGNGAE